ncbi:MAG: bifunctional riboflavin kinase/FAD synthetase [Actinomycetota bacterium]
MRFIPEITWHGAPIHGSALAIGIFDGVHIGHQAILNEGRKAGLPVVALTFDPHPTSIFAPDRVPTRLLTLHNRVHQLATHGATTTGIIKFTEEFSRLSPQDFIDQILIPIFDPQLVIVGENFTFGSQARGNVQYLKEHAPFKVVGVPLLNQGDITVSSTRIREAIKAGNIEIANQLLTRPHQLVGPVIHGEKRGRTIGYPTANIGLDSFATIPSDGVYAGWLSVGSHRWPSAISIGTNPTFEGVRGRQVEAYALDRNDLDLYDQEATVEFGWRLRDTIKFDGLDSLLTQMKIDCDEARKLTHSHA